jgi:phenylpropionate dioxygenase-like ring-hydroxylating dioxygenase large terminal subunit
MSAVPTSYTTFRGDLARLRNRVDMREKLQPEHYRREVDKIFRRAWLPLVSVGEIPQPGSYIVVEVPTLRTSLLVIRGQDGVVRAFHNMCRHRGNKLVASGKGCRLGFACDFHGWAFAANGNLVTVPDEGQFRDFDKSQFGLIAVNTEVWEDLVFVNFSPTPRQSLREWLGPLYDGYAGYFDRQEMIGQYSYLVDANWHLTINANTEGYHTLFLHRSTVPDYQGGKDNPMRHRPYFELMARHGRYSTQANPDHKMPPAEKLAYDGGRRIYPAFPALDPANTDLPAGLNPGRVAQWAFDIVEFFPHFLLLQGADFHQRLWFWPIDVDRTEMRVEAFAYKARTVGDRLAQSYSKVRSREVLREDISTMEAVHTMLKSGAMPEIILSQQELLLQHHFAVAAQMLDEP